MKKSQKILIICVLLFLGVYMGAQEMPQAEPVVETVPPAPAVEMTPHVPQQTQNQTVQAQQNVQQTQQHVQSQPAQTQQNQTQTSANAQTAPQRRQPPRDALVLYQNGDYAEAIAVCEIEIAQNPMRVESYVVLCWSLVRNRQYAEAEQRASDGLKVSPHDLRLIEIFGEAKYYLGKNNGALEQFQRYVASAPESSSRIGSAYYFMGEIYIRQARYQHADISLSAAVKKEPLFDIWWTRLGYAREMAGNYYEAIAAYDEALLLNAASTEARNGKNRVTTRLQ